VRSAIVAVGVVLIAIGIGLASDLSEPETVPTVSIPDVVRVRCEPDAVRLSTTTVQPQEDGIRFVVDNESKAQLFDVLPVGLEEAAAETPITPGEVTEATFAVPPGPVTLECLSGRETGRERVPGELTIVDPRALWVSPDLGCDTSETTEVSVPYEGTPETDEDPVTTARRAVPGLIGTDEIVKPGYPQTRWHGDLMVVIREGQTIGRVTRAQDESTWRVVVEACEGSALL
jgi:hypothetical protein